MICSKKWKQQASSTSKALFLLDHTVIEQNGEEIILLEHDQ